MSELILASASPRRAKLLRQIGIDFEQMTSRVEKERTDATDPRNLVLMLSKRKAEDVARKFSTGWVLGADTVVVLEERILGKPGSRNSAVEMLRSLSGREHSVFTGLTLIDSGNGRAVSQFEETRVWMRPLSEKDIEEYVATGEPLGKAGSYAIQGLGALLVERIAGCYYNVVGLPLVRLFRMMGEIGYPFRWSVCPGAAEVE
ncbi:MAG: septum formation inhibitor Maf [Gemmatimonadota bacterium]|nr:MAG: septum formation inhibitor Maf [Gemmatimonadota bacterium]